MYTGLTLVNGMILAVMIFLNSMLTSITGYYISTLIYHFIGLLLILFVSIVTKNKLSNMRKLSFIFFLPGVLSVITILLNNISIPKIGVTLAAGLGLFGQLIMSSLIDHFGLFERPRYKLKKQKIFGLLIISLGIVFMIIM